MSLFPVPEFDIKASDPPLSRVKKDNPVLYQPLNVNVEPPADGERTTLPDRVGSIAEIDPVTPKLPVILADPVKGKVAGAQEADVANEALIAEEAVNAVVAKEEDTAFNT